MELPRSRKQKLVVDLGPLALVRRVLVGVRLADGGRDSVVEESPVPQDHATYCRDTEEAVRLTA